jgi:NADH-quinone oxidoreductase subunit L
MRTPLLLLAALSIGYVFSTHPLDTHQAWLLQSFAGTQAASDQHWTGLVYGSVALSLLGAGLAYLQFRQKQALRKLDFRNHLPRIRRRFARDSRAMQPLWFFYRISFDRRIIDQTVEKIGITYVVLAHVVSWVDRVVVDGLVNFSAYLAGGIGKMTRRLQYGKVQAYFLFAVLGLVCIAIWMIL